MSRSSSLSLFSLPHTEAPRQQTHLNHIHDLQKQVLNPVHSLVRILLSFRHPPVYRDLHGDFLGVTTIRRLRSDTLEHGFDLRLNFVPVLVVQTLHLDAEVVFDFAHDHHIALTGDEGDGDTDTTETACAADAVQVCLDVGTVVGVGSQIGEVLVPFSVARLNSKATWG